MPWSAARFTVRRMMAVVLLLGLVFAVVHHAVGNWGPSEVICIAPMILVTTNILAWFQRARWQVFWVGFGLAGWAYLTFTLGSPLAEFLPTSWLLEGLHGRLFSTRLPDLMDDDFDGEPWRWVNVDQFRRAGQSVLSLVAGLLGGSLAMVLFGPRPEADRTVEPPEGSLLDPGWRDPTSA